MNQACPWVCCGASPPRRQGPGGRRSVGDEMSGDRLKNARWAVALGLALGAHLGILLLVRVARPEAAPAPPQVLLLLEDAGPAAPGEGPPPPASPAAAGAVIPTEAAAHAPPPVVERAPSAGIPADPPSPGAAPPPAAEPQAGGPSPGEEAPGDGGAAPPAGPGGAPPPATPAGDDAAREAIRAALARGPAARRERDLLLMRGGQGPVTGEALQARVAGLAQLDAEIIVARHRAEMGVNHPHVLALTAGLHGSWDPSISEVRALGIRPSTQAEQGLPEHMRKMLQMEADGAIGGAGGPIGPGQVSVGQATAALNLSATQCTYDYYALGWFSVLLDGDGNIIDLAVYRSSGREDVDAAIMDAIRQAGPFEAVPDDARCDDGLFRGTWEYGFRDYSGSSCRLKGQDGEPYHVAVIAFRGAYY